MSGQKSYGYATPRGIAGSLYDLSPYTIDSRINGETDPKSLKYGMGVIQGTTPGLSVKLPAAGTSTEIFEGIAMTGMTAQQDMNGGIDVAPLQTVGVLRQGRAWARVVADSAVSYGDSLYLVISGDNAGLFTNASAEDCILVSGRFIGKKGAGNIAPVELYQKQ